MAEIMRLKDGGKTAELLIYDIIGADMFGEGLTARRVREQLNVAGNLGDIETIEVRINSPGGNVSDGAAIYTALHQHPARIVVEIDGHALSAASLIAMAGDEIRMSANGVMMIHEAWGVSRGPAADHEAVAVQLRKLTDSAAATYAARSGQTKEAVLKLLEAETWMTGEEAKELGFATKVLPPKSGAQACWDPQWSELARMYKHTPDQVRNAPGADSSKRGGQPPRSDEARLASVPAALGKLASERPRVLLGHL